MITKMALNYALLLYLRPPHFSIDLLVLVAASRAWSYAWLAINLPRHDSLSYFNLLGVLLHAPALS